jgi:hypothetical protein
MLNLLIQAHHSVKFSTDAKFAHPGITLSNLLIQASQRVKFSIRPMLMLKLALVEFKKDYSAVLQEMGTASPPVDPSRQMRNIAAELVATFRAGTADAFPDLTGEVPCPVLPSSAKSTADYQFNGAMAISGLLKVSTTGTVIILIFLTLFH